MPKPKDETDRARQEGALLRGAKLVDEIIRFVEGGKAAIEIAEPHPCPPPRSRSSPSRRS